MCSQLFLDKWSGLTVLTSWCGVAIHKILLTFYSMVMASYLGAWFPASPCVYSVFQGSLPLSVLLCAVLILINVCAPSS